MRHICNLNDRIEEAKFGDDIEKLWEDGCEGILRAVHDVYGMKIVRNGKRR